MTVVRVKHGLKDPRRHTPPQHFGTRTDYLVGRSPLWRQDGIPLWYLPDDSPWIKYFAKFKPKIWKPSHGLSAVFCAKDHLDPKQIALIGFDRILYQDDDHSHKWYTPPGKPAHPWFHDQRAERECLDSLGIEIIDLAKATDEQIFGLGPDQGS